MMSTIQQWISDRAAGTALGPAASRVVEILATQPRLASYASTADLAERAGVNVATVVRTARSLGCSGWPELRLEVRNRYLASLSASQVLDEHAEAGNNPVFDAIRRDIENLEMLVRTLDGHEVRAIAEAIHDARRTSVLGSGTFAAPGVQLAHVGTAQGRDIVLEQHFGTHLANTVNRITHSDCLVVFNLWWLPHEVLEAAHIAHERGATVCTLTDLRSSPLMAASDHVVIMPGEGISSFPTLTPAMAVTHAILAALTRLGGNEAREAMARTDAVWERMGLSSR